MSLNHIINPENPYTSENKINADFGYITCINVNPSSVTSGRIVSGTVLTFDNASITGTAGSLYYALGVIPDNTYILKLSVTIAAPVASNTFSIEVEQSNIAHVGSFDALANGQLCPDTAIPCLLVKAVENISANKVKLVFNTADGSTLVAGSYSGTTYFII